MKFVARPHLPPKTVGDDSRGGFALAPAELYAEAIFALGLFVGFAFNVDAIVKVLS